MPKKSCTEKTALTADFDQEIATASNALSHLFDIVLSDKLLSIFPLPLYFFPDLSVKTPVYFPKCLHLKTTLDSSKYGGRSLLCGLSKALDSAKHNCKIAT